MTTTTKNEQQPTATNLPEGVVMVTVQIPVIVGDPTGYDGRHSHINGHIKGDAGRALQRAHLAQRAIVDHRFNGATHYVPGRESRKIDIVRAVFEQVASQLEAVAQFERTNNTTNTTNTD